MKGDIMVQKMKRKGWGGTRRGAGHPLTPCPRGERLRRVAVQFCPSDLRALDSWAKARGLGRAEALRAIVRRALGIRFEEGGAHGDGLRLAADGNKAKA